MGHFSCHYVLCLLLELEQDKIDAGADFVLTQFFYDTQMFIKYLARCRAAGITCPIIPGAPSSCLSSPHDIVLPLQHSLLLCILYCLSAHCTLRTAPPCLQE